MMMNHIPIACLMSFCLTAPLALAQPVPDKPQDYIVDLANVVDAGTERQLNGYLQELERKTGAQLITLVVDTTGGTEIRNFALATAQKWKLGQAGEDNGLLMVIAVKDRKWTIETGYGLEGSLPDAFCNQAGRKALVPRFRGGDYAGGVRDTMLVLANKVAADANVTIQGMPPRSLSSQGRPRGATRTGRSAGKALCFLIFMLIFFGMVFGRAGYSRRRYRYAGGNPFLWMVLGGMLGGRRSWGGGYGGGGFGGGFGGGSFGGGFGGGSFGGGGGGSFGGGGASGGW
jgi:uncharacterized protein